MVSSFRSRLCSTALLASLALSIVGCTTPVPGYRNEGLGPDERLLDLVDCLRDVEGNQGNGDTVGLVVDGGRLQNELRRLHLDYPTHTATLYVLASQEMKGGETERAAAYLDDLFRVQAAHPEAGVLRARLAIAEGNLPGAERVLDQQIKFTPDHAGLRESLSSVRFLANDYEGARVALERARRLGAPVWRIAFNLGLIEEGAGNDTLAMQRYETALQLSPDFAPAAARLAGLRAEFGEVVR